MEKKTKENRGQRRTDLFSVHVALGIARKVYEKKSKHICSFCSERMAAHGMYLPNYVHEAGLPPCQQKCSMDQKDPW